MKRRWLKVTIDCDRGLVDAVTDFLVGVMDAGVEVGVEDRLRTSVVRGYLECHGQTVDNDDTILKLKGHLKLLADIFEAPLPSLSVELIEEQDWSSSWKKFFKPFAIIPSLIIAPTWEKYHVKEGEQLIEIDPGMAFGTGHHPTTTLSVHFIRRAISMGNGEEVSVLDVGTGTGILGMVAVLFGARRVLGIDNDPEAVAVAKENVRGNGLEAAMSVSSASLSQIDPCFSLVTANIIHDVLQAMADDLDRLTAPGGHLILSGILHGDQSQSMIECFEKKGLILIDTGIMEEWAALLFLKQR